MDLERQVGLRGNGSVVVPDRRAMIRSIVLKLAAMGHQVPELVGDAEVLDLARDLFARYREQGRLLSDYLCPVDRRIQDFLDDLFAPLGLDQPVRLPSETLILDRYGLARELSLPLDSEKWNNEVLSSYRLDGGVLHNPLNDRRTTQGVFHVAEVGLPVPGDKVGVPLVAYARMLREALRPPGHLARLPFTDELGRSGRNDGVAVAAPARVPRRARRLEQEAARGALLRARRPRLESRLRRIASSATGAIRTCPRTTPASTSSIGPDTPAA